MGASCRGEGKGAGGHLHLRQVLEHLTCRVVRSVEGVECVLLRLGLLTGWGARIGDLNLRTDSLEKVLGLLLLAAPDLELRERPEAHAHLDAVGIT